jgi:TRAP-type C4-dicarboxylate transport system substrate-binding protein
MDRRSISAVALTLLAAVLAGCGSAPQPAVVDKAGSQTRILQMATHDGTAPQDEPPGIKTFLDSLASFSQGQIQFAVQQYYAGGQVDSETKVVQAIATGQLDGGFASVRAFANAGIPGLQAVEAPMTLTSYAAVKDLVSGPVAKDLLAQLNGTGVVGLGLAVGPLRRPFAATAPLLGPREWQGQAFRTFGSPVQDATIRALGGYPVHAGNEWTAEVDAGTLRGAEFDIPQYAINGLTTEAPYVTANLVLWPKVFVLSVSQKLWDTLTDQQRTWIQEAADAGTTASVDAPYDETSVARNLCDVGVRFVEASPSQLADLHAAVAPVISDLANDSVNGPLLAKIQTIAARYQTDVPDVPGSCQSTGPALSPSIPPTTSSLPPGTYRSEVTAADVESSGLSVVEDPGLVGITTLVVNGDETYVLSCKAVTDPGKDCGELPDEAGLLRGTGNTVYFVSDATVEARVPACQPPGQCDRPPLYYLDWSLDGTTLTFTNRGGMERSKDYFSIEPWTRID